VSIAAVLLAAGGGTRFAGPTHKLLAEIDGRPVYRHALGHVLAAMDEGAVDRVIVVTGAVDLDVGDQSVTVVRNAGWQRGQAGSLQLGLAEAAGRGAEYAVIGLADQPFVDAAAWVAVARAPSARPIVVATYDGIRGPNPVRLHRSVWDQLATDGDEGARPLMRLHPEWIDEVACVGSAADIDTLEDLGQWTSY
jgi:CTP:molybdopterin cytidylyltransferase MocA